MDQQQKNKIALTEYAHGAGCGCKIAPSVLQEILKTNTTLPFYDKLIVGNDSNDDAAVYQLSDEEALISTTDFFTPIVDDAFLFGQIAAANAVSDVYAMGGNPLLAVAILGFPVDTLPVSIAQEIIEGARNICAAAKIPLAGGHSIDSKEPIFGLAVNGLVKSRYLKRNDNAAEGDYLLLTKPIGTGILSTAQKRKKLLPEHYEEWTKQMIKLNSIGAELGAIEGVSAMTDITGFGLLGHLFEMTTESKLSMELYYDKVPILASARQYAAERIIPDATYRNWNAYNSFVQFEAGVNVMEAFNILPDPQTNGGLLVAVKENALEQVKELFSDKGYEDFTAPIGKMIGKNEKTVYVK